MPKLNSEQSEKNELKDSRTKKKHKRSPFPFWGAIVEAWEELIINRGRVILSLTGVAAAVWAMATVIALGGVISQAQEQEFSRYSGQPGTIRLNITQNSQGPSEKDSALAIDTHEFTEKVASQTPESSPPPKLDENGLPEDAFSKAALRTAKLMKSNYWSRHRELSGGTIQAPGYQECSSDPESWNKECYSSSPTFHGVDPKYFDIFSLRLLQGRLLVDSDASRQMNPVVINEIAWDFMGKPDLRYFPRLRLQENPSQAFTVVGVVQNLTKFDGPTFYMNYESFIAAMPPQFVNSSTFSEFILVAPSQQQREASQVVGATLKGLLGPSWQVAIANEGGQPSFEVLDQAVTIIITVIGFIVISLGALGLLTVSIVTVKYRVREIGIRRAMGASARRIFFSVFLESVVATTVSGIIGVILSILTIRSTPLVAWMDIPFKTTNIGYPMSAALLGVAIAAGVGALAGIIPATIAVRIKPIDAIRF